MSHLFLVCYDYGTVLIYGPKTDHGCLLEQLYRGHSNVYPQWMFWVKIRKDVYLGKLPFSLNKVGFFRLFITRTLA